eukprot:CAMPEP_0196141910 /NCGR_PEP_ID=MMETSP0910-20130528/10701_1 /TAXON_ID=49265 /ORGANISM="Thalassiosira rotula, Strain GSO102" /LENGTH=520 /DNA_ID=CAMNT_0041403139 /DNA_START=174 /DNA_END=1736 /DNA_ORIENTATION=+
MAASCRVSNSAFAFAPGSISTATAHWAVGPASPCVAYSESSFLGEAHPATQVTLSIRQVDFFKQQLDVCEHIIIDSDNNIRLEHDHDSEGDSRKRFKEHPRCTARFGDVLLHAKNCAITSEEYQNAVQNARSIVNYVRACRESRNNVHPIRKGLTADIANALGEKSLRKFRIRQIEDGSIDAEKSDFTHEQADLEILGRLYYSAIRRSVKYLDEVGLTLDHGGFTALLALCRAASMAPGFESSSSPDCTDMAMLPPNDGARLDAALSNHFNGITAPGCRFLFSPRHGIDDTKVVGRATRLIVAFSSLGNGLVRHEFGGSLAKMNNELLVDGEDINVTFDVLFVADPSQSWYQKDSQGNFDGFREYEQRIHAATRPYDKVSLVGDSMGGSGALLFSHLATESVVAFSPQINLVGDAHVSRCDMSPGIRDRYCTRLVRSVEEAAARRTKIFVHRGVEEADVGHTDRLTSCLFANVSEGSERPAEYVKIIEHKDCPHHQIAVHLKKKGQLAHVMTCNLLGELK